MYVRLQSSCSANAEALTVAGFADRGRETGLATGGRSLVTLLVIVTLVAVGQLTSALGGIADDARSCRWLKSDHE